MFRSSSDLPAKSMLTQIRPEDKFSGRIISKETSTAPNSSFRVYYGGVSGAVPFTWESRPGTPKHPLSHSSTSLPPLTPPPSFYSYNSDSTHRRRRSRSNLFRNFWSNMNQRTSSRRIPPSPSLSSSSWSSCSSTRSSSSSVWTPSTPFNLRGKIQRRNWEFFDHHQNKEINDDDDDDGWRTPCFSFGKQINGGSIRDVYAVGVAKKALLTLLGRGGSGH